MPKPRRSDNGAELLAAHAFFLTESIEVTFDMWEMHAETNRESLIKRWKYLQKSSEINKRAMKKNQWKDELSHQKINNEWVIVFY